MESSAERDAPLSQDLATLRRFWEELCSQYATLGTPPNDARQGETIYHILVSLPETAGFADLIDQFPEIRVTLQDAGAVHTIWVPNKFDFGTFDEKDLQSILRNHISPHWMPLQHILRTPNIPTLLHPPDLNGNLRLRLRPPNLLRTDNIMKVNFEATMIQSDIIGANGVIHLLDRPLDLPLSIYQIIMQLPNLDFSMFQLGLQKTGLVEEIMSKGFVGITIFAPTNIAFSNLGSLLRDFLFQSDEGCRYLRALLKFHVAPQHTLLSNAYYADSRGKPEEGEAIGNKSKTNPDVRETPRTIIGCRQFSLPTMLLPQKLNVDITRYGGLISMQIKDGQAPVTVQDLIGMDGVVHIVSRIALPEQSDYKDMSVNELKSILKDYDL